MNFSAQEAVFLLLFYFIVVTFIIAGGLKAVGRLIGYAAVTIYLAAFGVRRRMTRQQRQMESIYEHRLEIIRQLKHWLEELNKNDQELAAARIQHESKRLSNPKENP